MNSRSKFTILVVDDEELIREVTTIMIEEHGGSVLLASDGEEGLNMFLQHSDSIDLVLLDFSMPRRNGYELFVEIKKINPGMPMIMASGLGMIPEVQALVSSGRIQFMSKPYHEVQLIEAIDRALATGTN